MDGPRPNGWSDFHRASAVHIYMCLSVRVCVCEKECVDDAASYPLAIALFCYTPSDYIMLGGQTKLGEYACNYMYSSLIKRL